jgi:hypothetical protein
MAIDIETRERLVAVERDLAHLVKAVDVNTARIAVIYDLMLEAKGVTKTHRWWGHGLTATISFVISTSAALVPYFWSR